jgi:protein SCO1/2
MKPTVVLLSLGVLAASAMVSVMVLRPHHPAIAEDAGRTFHVRGIVRDVRPEDRSLRIAHEEILGYMPAMTMPFSVRSASLLAGLSPGAEVAFDLVVTDEDAWIARIERLPAHDAAASQGVTADSAASGSTVDRALLRVEAGEIVPEVALVDQDGAPVRLSEFRGRAVLITFIYTRCPIPNFCPLMSKHFAALQERLAPEFPGRFQLLSISIDPAFDRPEILREYAARYGADPAHWRFATGTAEQIGSVAAAFGLHHEPENGLISHDLRTALIGPDGRLVHVWKSNVWTPFEVQRRVREVLDPDRYLTSR